MQNQTARPVLSDLNLLCGQNFSEKGVLTDGIKKK